MASVTVVDYGVGNLLSVTRALVHVGATVETAGSSDALVGAERLVLPGVGAFAHGMGELRNRGLIEAIRDHAKNGRPFLGICLGMQMMLDISHEFGETEGLGLISGSVEAIPPTDTDGKPQKVPHIGWSQIAPSPGADWAATPLAGTEQGAGFYFVHSFEARPEQASHCIAECRYGNRPVVAAIGHDNMFGCQFHPEKSGPVGLDVIRKYMNL